jgi:hypothetical protein
MEIIKAVSLKLLFRQGFNVQKDFIFSPDFFNCSHFFSKNEIQINKKTYTINKIFRKSRWGIRYY